MSATIFAEEENIKQASLYTKTIVLLVEDDSDDSTLISDIITEQLPLYSIITIDKGETVLSRLSHMKATDLPRLIILDYNMAPLTGLDVLKALKGSEEFAHIPVAIYTSSRYPKHKQECLVAGACSFLTKSNTLKELKKDVVEMLTFCN